MLQLPSIINDPAIPQGERGVLMAGKKMKIAVLDLTCCTGCEANLLGTDASIADYSDHFEVTSWRMVEDEKPADYDVVLVEGYACNDEQVDILRQARETSAVVVAFGTCAISGNIFSQLKPENFEKISAAVYGPGHTTVTRFVKPVPSVIKVDHVIRGCPANVDAIRKFLDDLSRHPVSSRDIKVFAPDYVARIEGHAKLSVDFGEKRAHFYPDEGERFVEALVVGKPYLNAPKVHSRICGICPVAHSLCSIMAIEQALGIQVSGTAGRLRQVFQCGQMVQSHLLHLYFMVLPSMLGIHSSLQMTKRYPAELELAKSVKRVAEEIFKLVGGAALHPVSLTAGGFTRVPDSEALSLLRRDILDILLNARRLVGLFTGYDQWPDAVTSAHMMCMEPADGSTYPLTGHRVWYGGPESFDVQSYLDFVHEKVLADHPAKVGFLMPDKPLKTGAIARISRYADRLHSAAAEAFHESKMDFANPFHNNTAQAVEMLHYLEEAARVLEELEGENLEDAVVDRGKIREMALDQEGAWPVRGVAAIEAPRGILFHEISIESEGNITSYNIIPPTNLNLSGLDEEIALLLYRYQPESRSGKVLLIEDLIRASDPCITCAVH